MFIALLAAQYIPGIYSIDRATIAMAAGGVILLLGAVLSVMRQQKG